MLLVLLLLVATFLSRTASAQSPSYPATPRDSVVDVYFGTRADTCYPATLLLTGDHDNRVVPSHSYKFAAALQEAQECGRPILLRVARDASHTYASQASAIAELSDMWSFTAAALGAGGRGAFGAGDLSRGARGRTRERDTPIGR